MDINWGLLAPLLVIQLILMVIALIDCIRSKEANGPKGLWIAVIIFINILGPVAYFIFGRKRD